MVRIFPRRSNDVTYFTSDPARELEDCRDGGPGWWWRGDGDTQSPADVARVLTTSARSAICGYDVVVAAPRSTSILVALDAERAGGVVAAHRASVSAALSYLEDRAVVVRGRDGGREYETGAQWDSVVSFTHGLNRHGEPHLHDHVLVGARPRDVATVLDSRALFAHARAADALYRSSLRHELAQRTPWSSWRSFQGVEHVVGVDEGYRALWGGHHRDRGEKLHWSRADALNAWARDLANFSPVGVDWTPSTERGRLDEHRFAGALEGRLDVSRRYAVSAWADATPWGQDSRDTTRSVDALYPRLREGRGVHEAVISVREARMLAVVRELGPRPLERGAFDEWCQRSRERGRSRDERSR